ncbi:bifunctional 2-polyprenyl-6-hydroxyphenol methylase/3-demethylubiquinol 3-O-methyltransferase UbiG [Flavobacterium sp. J27]|uniref:class I SAM-dependent methyltransferase n=1 Tax=Flavobacterium sp. J27 TaxID=2060419 RepID=UPI001031D09A|nr:class I SAM-dependent methyltransferase [Flavobacterium sp. J27]
MNFEKNDVYIQVKDFSVSGESFSLLLDKDLELLKTNPQPTASLLPSYYESEDYISHTDHSRSLFENMYQLVKKRAIQKKVKLITKYSSRGTLLDIGAGTGDFLVQANKEGWQTLGLEPNQKAKQIAIAKEVHFTDTLEELASHSFDVITMWHVLEHVPNLNEQIEELKRLLKPDGILIVAVPNFKSYDAQYYKQFWAAYDVPRHLWHFSKKAIQFLFQKHNINLFQVKPMWFDSFYVSLLSEKYKTGKMNFIKGFCIGFLSNCKGIFNNEFSSHIYLLKNQ